jgi:hypothetical protein
LEEEEQPRASIAGLRSEHRDACCLLMENKHYDGISRT